MLVLILYFALCLFAYMISLNITR
uniref:Uncharacterized protein n=1 Tax=Anguilla anguilla TaxID=7936 RepID=A0A0E9VHM7_ANGAN